jgi:hypothetical protein
MVRSHWRLGPTIDWPAALVGTVLNVVLLALLAVPAALAVTGLLELAHRIDPAVPAVRYGAVWALVYAVGLVNGFVHVELRFSPRR